MTELNIIDLIIRKRDGEPLKDQELSELIGACTRGEVPDYQMSAFLMAAFLNGMNDTETLALTRSMLYSGEVVDLSDVPGLKVDKHSSGGVGDKISLILAPVVASCGVPVPMISGRGLGHTGGTLDKLEAIPGFRTDLSINRYRDQLQKIGIAMIGQTEEIAPADRKMYALRDVTGTVESIPFITASILSKKLAEGIDALVLDIKCGKGAFMKSENRARALAEKLVTVSREFQKPAVAYLTDMNTPLGYGIGNWPETAEAIRCLKGEDVGDVMEVTYALAGEMLRLGGDVDTTEAGINRARRAVYSGHALEMLRQMVKHQGGDVKYIENPSIRPDCRPAREVVAPPGASGYVTAIDAYKVGRTCVNMGAGRSRKEDTVDPTAGITLNKKPGDPVEKGEILAWLHTNRTSHLDEFEHAVCSAYSYGAEAPEARSLLLDRYSDRGWDRGPNESHAP